MELTELIPGTCYKVFFEKDIPIEFKFVKKKPDDKMICQTQTGKIFNFNELPQHLTIKDIYPKW